MSKRKSGYQVTIKGFIPADKGDLDQQAKVLSSLATAKREGKFSEVAGLLMLGEMTAVMTSKEIVDPPAADPAPALAAKK